jgi:DivIVA domain-containing protein
MFVLANVLIGVARVLEGFLFVYQWVLIARAVTSWVSADPRNPIVRFLLAVTEPPLRLIRRRLPAEPALLPPRRRVPRALRPRDLRPVRARPVPRRLGGVPPPAAARPRGRRTLVNLTPSDVQRQTFGKRFRGFDPDEVRAFLAAVAEEMAALQRERRRRSSSSCGTSS